MDIHPILAALVFVFVIGLTWGWLWSLMRNEDPVAPNMYTLVLSCFTVVYCNMILSTWVVITAARVDAVDMLATFTEAVRVVTFGGALALPLVVAEGICIAVGVYMGWRGGAWLGARFRRDRVISGDLSESASHFTSVVLCGMLFEAIYVIGFIMLMIGSVHRGG